MNSIVSTARQKRLNTQCVSAFTDKLVAFGVLIEKIRELLMVREEFDKFIETTENSQAKIDESVATLLYVVKKESDTIIRKKTAINA